MHAGRGLDTTRAWSLLANSPMTNIVDTDLLGWQFDFQGFNNAQIRSKPSVMAYIQMCFHSVPWSTTACASASVGTEWWTSERFESKKGSARAE